MERFRKIELLDIIERITIENNTKPCIKDVLIWVNKDIHVEDFDDYASYFKMVLNEPVLRYYVKLYGLSDLLSKKNDKNKNPDYDMIESIREKFKAGGDDKSKNSRFTDTELRDIIQEYTKAYGKKPSVIDLTRYINTNSEKYKKATDNGKAYVTDGSVRYYINLYGLRELIQELKTRRKT